MKANRLVLALVLAGLATPALADSGDAPTLVKPAKQSQAVGRTPLGAPGGLAATPWRPGPHPGEAPEHSEFRIVKRVDAASPKSASEFQEFHITKVKDNGTMPLDAPAGLAAAPARPSAAHFGGGQGSGKASIQDLNWSSHSPSATEGSGGPTIRSSKPKEIVVVGSKLEEATPSSLLLRTPLDAPAKPSTAERTVPSISEIVMTKSTDSTIPAPGGGSGNDTFKSGLGNDFMRRQDGMRTASVPPAAAPLSAGALPQPTGSGMGPGKVQFTDLHIPVIPRTASPVAPATPAMKGIATLPPGMPAVRR